jgi:hypothetical protein
MSSQRRLNGGQRLFVIKGDSEKSQSVLNFNTNVIINHQTDFLCEDIREIIHCYVLYNKQDRQNTYNATLRRFRATIVVVENRKYYMF